MSKKKVLATLYVYLNVFDTVSTYRAVTTGVARELNPVMAALINFHPLAFLAFKIIIGSGMMILAYRRLDDRRFIRGAILLNILYGVVVLSHIIQWLFIFKTR